MQAPSKGNPSNLIDSVFFCNRDYNYTYTVFSWKKTITITHTMLCLANNYECNSHGWCSMGFVTKSWPLGMFNENSQLEAVLSALPLSYCITSFVCLLSVQLACINAYGNAGGYQLHCWVSLVCLSLIVLISLSLSLYCISDSVE